MNATQSATSHFDVLIVGAGISGMYQLYKARQLGLKARVFEAGNGVAGTWYWNRYPGARCDSPGFLYQYWFSDELLAEWNWSERFPAQPETERYLNRVADKFNLRPDIQFNTRIEVARFDEAAGRWTLTTAQCEEVDAQFLVMATGGLSEAITPGFPGEADFAGESLHTSRWPRDGVDFKGKRVGVFGTGATGIQVIQTIAPDVAHLTVFQRTPTFAIPIRNPKFDDAARADIRARYPHLKQLVPTTFAGFDFNPDPRGWYNLSADERRRTLETLWADGSLKFWVGSFPEVLTDQQVNDEVTAFVQDKIRARIKDPKVAEKLIPRSYGFGTKRVPLENGYYDTFNRANVRLVDLNETPVERVLPQGVKTTERLHELDVIVYATGFDATTGALSRVDVRGRGGQTLKDAWGTGIRTWVGMQVHGFPNLFMTMGPMSPAAAFCNVPTCSQQQVDWITDTIAFTRSRGAKSIEPTREAEANWVAHHDAVANATLVPKTKSWYMGSNVKGKEPRLLAYIGGVGAYKQACDAVKAGGYRECVVA